MLRKGMIVKIKSGSISTSQFTNDDITIDKPCKVKVVKAWHDYEIGYRFIGENKEGQTVYFGQFDLYIPTYKSL